MALRFGWDPDKARRNLRKHRLSFEEATTAFEDDRSVTVQDPTHSIGEERFLLLGRTSRGRIVVALPLPSAARILTPSASSQPASPTAASDTTMKKAKRKTASPRRPADADNDLLPHYDFRGGVRGKYAA